MNKIQLLPLREAQTVAFKEEMQEAFQYGFDFQSSLLTLGRADTSIALPSLNRSLQSYYKDDNQWQVLPDKDFYQSLVAEGAEAYEAVNNDGQRVGGAIIAIDAAKHRGELAFLYVKVGIQSKGIGQAIWKAIEALHPETEVWETCTPYFDLRNIHFYINRLGFHAVEFFNEHHPDPNMPRQPNEQREQSDVNIGYAESRERKSEAQFDQEDGLFRFEKRMAD